MDFLRNMLATCISGTFYAKHQRAWMHTNDTDVGKRIFRFQSQQFYSSDIRWTANFDL